MLEVSPKDVLRDYLKSVCAGQGAFTAKALRRIALTFVGIPLVIGIIEAVLKMPIDIVKMGNVIALVTPAMCLLAMGMAILRQVAWSWKKSQTIGRELPLIEDVFFNLAYFIVVGLVFILLSSLFGAVDNRLYLGAFTALGAHYLLVLCRTMYGLGRVYGRMRRHKLAE